MTVSLTENAVAISAVFHSEDPKAYGRFYAQYGPILGGFPGIWSYVADAATAFTEVETELKIEDGDYWIEAIDAFVDLIRVTVIGTDEELRQLARRAIIDNCDELCECGHTLNDGEGYDGKCGSCADKAEMVEV